jgi:hypothetical protein
MGRCSRLLPCSSAAIRCASGCGDGGRIGNPAAAHGVRRAWENGSVWVAWVIGAAMGPSLDEVVFVLAIIVASEPRSACSSLRNHSSSQCLRSRRSFSSAIWPGRPKPGVPATAARLGAASPTEAPRSYLRSRWCLADCPGHGRTLSRWRLKVPRWSPCRPRRLDSPPIIRTSRLPRSGTSRLLPLDAACGESIAQGNVARVL